jgi:hypothetical protein
MERAQEVDPSMDFMDQRKKISLQKLYNENPMAMPNKEVKPLRFSKIDKFATKVENEAECFYSSSSML